MGNSASKVRLNLQAEHFMSRMDGAYCLVMLTPSQLIACRDPLGVRPLCLGRYKDGWVVASESCALETIGAEFTNTSMSYCAIPMPAISETKK